MNIIANIKDFFSHLVMRLYGLNKKEFGQLLIGSIAGIFVIVIGLIYFVQSHSNALLQEIETLQAQQKRTRRLLVSFAELSQEEERFKSLVEQYKNFSMKIYFEQFCKDQGITAQSGWDTTTVELSPQVDEVTLTAVFKDMTTPRLVGILQELDKKELVYVKNLRIKTEKDHKISFEIALASIRNK